jgi:AraC-like DNA-binding protein
VPIWTAQKLKSVADRYVSEAFERESQPRVKELAAKLKLSRGDFSRLFEHLVGEHPSTYLRRGQIECAKAQLARTDLSMNVIAYRCGFGTRTTFFRSFKRVTGMTPGAYRSSRR